MDKVEFKKRASYVTIEGLKGMMWGVIGAIILAPLTIMFIEWFLNNFLGYHI